jgi:hypothetical protein
MILFIGLSPKFLLPLLGGWKGDDKRDPLSRMVVHFDLALMGKDNFMDDGQTQT